MDTKNLCWSVGVLAAMGLTGCAADDVGSVEALQTVMIDKGPVGDIEPSAEIDGDVYVTVRPDFRRCAAPRCGGFFVKAVNGGPLRCVDGTSAAECYVGAIDLAPTMLDDDQVKRVLGEARTPDKVVLRGELSTSFDRDFGAYGVLSVSEAWLGQLDVEAKGTFARVTDKGIVCVAAPCPSLHESVLNGEFEQDIAGLQFQHATLAERDAALKALRQPEGIIVAADEYTVTGPAGEAPGLDASQYYAPVASRAAQVRPATGR